MLNIPQVGKWLVAGALLFACAVGIAHEDEKDNPLLPPHPEGRGGACVEDTQFMRRNHMMLLFKKRNETMRQGIRTTQHSLKVCIECHADQKSDGQYIPVNDPGQFCRSCHQYAGIQPDCFECHATTPPQPTAQNGGVP